MGQFIRKRLAKKLPKTWSSSTRRSFFSMSEASLSASTKACEFFFSAAMASSVFAFLESNLRNRFDRTLQIKPTY
jgi:hypothetical protein